MTEAFWLLGGGGLPVAHSLLFREEDAVTEELPTWAAPGEGKEGPAGTVAATAARQRPDWLCLKVPDGVREKEQSPAEGVGDDCVALSAIRPAP